jgi:glycolate oxidase iron-sulfur subunit
MDSPRGRIVLMDEVRKGEAQLTDDVVSHFDRCLGCMACVTTCPSGVRYNELIEATRPQVERNYRRSFSERAFRRLLFETFTHPGRLRAMAPVLAAYQRTGLQKKIRGSGSLSRFPRFAAMERLLPSVNTRSALRKTPEVTPAKGVRRGRVGLLQGCVQRVFFSDVNRATIDVLTAEGYEVFAPADPRCCGALMFHSGYEREALTLAKRLIERFEDCDVIAVNAAGCGSSMKDYGAVLEDDAQWGERGKAFSEKVRDISEILMAEEPVARRHPIDMKIAYHDSCHLTHAQGVRAQPRDMLTAIPGVELLEPPEWEVCCGSAGIYNLLQPEAGAELGVRKAKNIAGLKAEAVVAGNPGCAMQIATHLSDRGEEVPIFHPIEVVAASIASRRL